MINANDKIIQLIQLNGQLIDQENYQDKTRASISKVDEIIAQPSIKYLLEPYENGFWEARLPWNALSHFSQYLLDNTQTLADIEKEADFQKISTTSLHRRLPEEKREELLQITSLSAALQIFDILARERFGHVENNNSIKYNWLPKIPMNDLREKFSTAAEIYEERIYFEGIRPRIRLNDPFQISGGLAYILERPAENGVLHVIAPRRQDLQAVVEFFHALGSTPHTTLQRVFAPDDSLFKPYFSVLSAIFPHVIRDEQISRSFAQALEYYEKDDFQHCISTLGLIAEGYLQRIYSSLLREENANGLTLGQIIDRIHKRISELTNPPKATPKSIDGTYEMIKKIDATTSVEDIKPLLREIVQLIQDSRNTLGKRIDDITKINTRSSPFPSQVIENLTELLKWRNAASHNSRVPLAAHEADRTLYCLVRVITWWQEQLRKLDWSKTKIELLEELIMAAK